MPDSRHDTLSWRALVIGFWLFVVSASASAEVRWIDTERSTVRMHLSLSSPWSGEGAGPVLEAPLAEGSLEDTESPHLALVINVGAMRVVVPGLSPERRQILQKKIFGPDGLDAERFSRITYHSLTIEQLGAGVWIVRGELEMRGRFLPLKIRTVRRGDQFTGTTTVHPSDFGIAPIPIAGNSRLLGKDVRVDFDVVLELPDRDIP